MIDRHAVQQMLTAGVHIGDVARHFEVSRRMIERIRNPPLPRMRGSIRFGQSRNHMDDESVGSRGEETRVDTEIATKSLPSSLGVFVT